MMERSDPDLSLFGDWPVSADFAACAGVAGGGGEGMKPSVAGYAPEMKSLPAQAGADAAAELPTLLNAMTAELKEQFVLFRDLREGAQRLVEKDASDEAAQKLLRADAKAAADAVSLIVRTLEKIDALQRQLAHDREEAAERDSDNRSYAAARAFFLARIEALALEKARALAEGRG